MQMYGVAENYSFLKSHKGPSCPGVWDKTSMI